MSSPPPRTYSELVSHLLLSPSSSTEHLIVSPSQFRPQASRPYDVSFAPHIAALQLHPSLEAALHLLNHDLASAHFLVRHMQSPPAVEGMLLHALLHRIEGDFENAQAWVRDVWADEPDGKELMTKVYGAGDAGRVAKQAIDDVQHFRRSGRASEAELARLARAVSDEFRNLLAWCEAKFGTAPVPDASEAWVRPDEKIRKIGEDQVSGGGGGFRTF